MTATVTQAPTSWVEVRDTARRLGLADARSWVGIDADDVAQEAVLAYFRAFGEGPGPDLLHAWLRRAVRNAFVDAHRRLHGRDPVDRRLRHRPLGHTELDQLFARRKVRDVSPSTALVRREVFDRVLHHLKGRELLVFRSRMAGVSAREVADALDTTPAAVDQSFARAKRRLREALEVDTELLMDLRGDLGRHAHHPRLLRRPPAIRKDMA